MMDSTKNYMSTTEVKYNIKSRDSVEANSNSYFFDLHGKFLNKYSRTFFLDKVPSEWWKQSGPEVIVDGVRVFPLPEQVSKTDNMPAKNPAEELKGQAVDSKNYITIQSRDLSLIGTTLETATVSSSKMGNTRFDLFGHVLGGGVGMGCGGPGPKSSEKIFHKHSVYPPQVFVNGAKLFPLPDSTEEMYSETREISRYGSAAF